MTWKSFFLPALAAAFAAASPITIAVPNGAKIQISATYNGGGSAFTNAGLDNGAFDEDPTPGKFKFTPPNQSQIKTLEVKSLGVVGPGVAAIGAFNFGPLGLDNWTPLSLPLFGSTTTAAIYVTQVDVPSYAPSVRPAPGTPVTINNGAVSGQPGVTVRDASGVYAFNTFFDVFVTLDIPNLPLVTGQGTALQSVSIGTPEPSSMLLILIGAGALLLRRRT